MPFVLMNWKLTADPVSISSWVSESEHKRFLANPLVKKFFTGKYSYGKGVQRIETLYYEYVFDISQCNVREHSSGWGFSIGSENFFFTLAARATFGIQTEGEVREILATIN